MPTAAESRKLATLWLIVSALAGLALLVGIWNRVVEKDGGGDWSRVLLSLGMTAFALAMYRRSRSTTPDA